jgi:hypothetical protein
LEIAAGDSLQRDFARKGAFHLKSGIVQAATQRLTEGFIVIHDENVESFGLGAATPADFMLFILSVHLDSPPRICTFHLKSVHQEEASR